MGILKKLGKAIAKPFKAVVKSVDKLLPGTGKSAAKRAQNAANQYVQEAATQQAELDRKTNRERKRAQKIAVRGLRSKRSAGYFNTITNPGEGSGTIG